LNRESCRSARACGGSRTKPKHLEESFALAESGTNPQKPETALPAVAVLPDLLHGEETRVWGDRAYQGQTEVVRGCAPRAQDDTQRRCRYKGEIVDEVEWARNRTKSKVRAKVEHLFQVLKLQFGFVKVRYRGLKKNAPAVCHLHHGESVCQP